MGHKKGSIVGATVYQSEHRAVDLPHTRLDVPYDTDDPMTASTVSHDGSPSRWSKEAMKNDPEFKAMIEAAVDRITSDPENSLTEPDKLEKFWADLRIGTFWADFNNFVTRRWGGFVQATNSSSSSAPPPSSEPPKSVADLLSLITDMYTHNNGPEHPLRTIVRNAEPGLERYHMLQSLKDIADFQDCIQEDTCPVVCILSLLKRLQARADPF